MVWKKIINKIKGNGNKIIQAQNSKILDGKSTSIEGGVHGSQIINNSEKVNAKANINYVDKNRPEEEAKFSEKLKELMNYLNSPASLEEINEAEREELLELTEAIYKKLNKGELSPSRLKRYNETLGNYVNLIQGGSLITGVISAATELIQVWLPK